MAGSINKAIIVGNLGSDPQIRTMQNGKKIASFSVATSESWKDKNSGQRQERTEWHRISVMNEVLAGVAESYLKKGAKVYIEGQIQTRKWTDQSGQEKFATEIVLSGYNAQLVMLDSREKADTREGGYDRPYSRDDAYKPSNEILEDDIPF